MDDLVATFSTLARVEEMRAARSAAQAEEEEDVMERVFNTEEEEYLHSLFCSMDANGDGRLSMAEFRQSMAMLGDELDGSTVSASTAFLDMSLHSMPSKSRAVNQHHLQGCLLKSSMPTASSAAPPSGLQVALIGDAMELEGFITEEQFRDIVEVRTQGG
jgi:hypothetical protein